MRDAITIGRVSAETGVNIETIRYYERIELMNAPPRSPGGHRLYGAKEVSRLRFIRRGRELGFSLETIRSLMRLEHEDEPCRRVKALTEAHLAQVREKITDLQRLEATLARLAHACENAAPPSCPVIKTLAQRR
jgi:MerR family transcriptional regulator, mercuric resistance operon regulatory protein